MITSSFDDVLAQAVAFRWRAELNVETIPAPQRIAPHAFALEATVELAGRELGNGRLILLHDPAGNVAWEGTYRCVCLVKAEVEPELVSDPLLSEVGWSWLNDALLDHHALCTSKSGTVTTVSSRGFGAMSKESDISEIEIRASWTPELPDDHSITSHLAAWQTLLCVASGLPPVPEGVIPLGPRLSSGPIR